MGSLWTAVCKAKFLKGHTVRAVWVQFEDENENLSGQRLFLSTLHTLPAEDLLLHYARRWSIEPLFNQMKNSWGWRDTWQQSRQVLHRWTQILSVAYALPQLLATCRGDQVGELLQLTPWRKKNQVTAGRVRLGLQRILGNVRVRDWWDPTYRIFQPPGSTGSELNRAIDPEKQEYMMSKSNRVDQNPPPS